MESDTNGHKEESNGPEPAYGEMVPAGPRKKRKGKPYRRKLQDEFIRDRFLLATMMGMSRKASADWAGIDVKTVDSEILRNPEFSALVRFARSDGEFKILQQIHDAVRADWRAGAWLLARWKPDEWGDRKPDMMTVEQFQAAIASLAAVIIQDLPPDKATKAAEKIEQILRATKDNKGE